MTQPDDRRRAPAAARNRDPILNALAGVLPERGNVLEVASGTGEHAIHFARALPGLVWQPSDPDAAARRSIAAWIVSANLPNVLPPIALDAAEAIWPVDTADAIVCINMLHISPWNATEGLMRGAGRILPGGALLCLYGPFIRSGRPLEPGNIAFNAELKARDSRWGLRNVTDVECCAKANGLNLIAVNDMPASNIVIVFRKD